MALWAIVAAIVVLPYLMMLTARAIHRDDSLQPQTRRWMAAGVVLLSGIVIPAYWIDRALRARASR